MAPLITADVQGTRMGTRQHLQSGMKQQNAFIVRGMTVLPSGA
ncbi:hypothetical protein [Hydrogenophaga sp.]